MNFTAQKASRKWANGAFRRIAAAMVTVAAAGAPAWHANRAGLGGESVPRGAVGRPVQGCIAKGAGNAAPRARGGAAAEAAPGRGPVSRARQAGQGAAGVSPNGKPDQQAAPAPQPTPQPSACRLALTDAIAIAPSIPDIHGAGGCGGEDLVRLEAIVLPDKRQVSVKPAAILRCPDGVRAGRVDPQRYRAAGGAPRQHRSPISTISTRSNAAAATASSAQSSPNTAAPMRSTFAPSSSPTAARSR